MPRYPSPLLPEWVLWLIAAGAIVGWLVLEMYTRYPF